MYVVEFFFQYRVCFTIVKNELIVNMGTEASGKLIVLGLSGMTFQFKFQTSHKSSRSLSLSHRLLLDKEILEIRVV